MFHGYTEVYVETYQTIHFKFVQFIVCPLHLDKAVKTHTHTHTLKKLLKLLNIAKAVRDTS